MIKLTSETLNGIWAGVTMPWDENYCFDEDMYAKNIQRAIVTIQQKNKKKSLNLY